MPNRLTLAQMMADLRARRLSSSELVSAHLRQIGDWNPRLNAFISIFADEALEAARRADESEPRGRLHGIPLTIKDSFDMAGQPTLCGSRFRIGHRASADATAVARLREAGAVFLGKTSCPEFLNNYETDNYIVGRTNSPWDLERTPGGSSGGEAAAIAAFCSAGGMGSDGGGSIREPAHFCGICGLKPTPGRVPATGHFPNISHPGGLLGVGGPMARTARDLRILFEVTAGYDDQDPFSLPTVPAEPGLSGLRVGVLENFNGVPVAAPLRAAVSKAACALEQLGIPAEPFQPRGMKRASRLWWFFFERTSAPFSRKIFDEHPENAHWTGTELLRRAQEEPEPSAREIMENLAARDAMRAGFLRQMREYPVLLLPPCGITAFRHRERGWTVEGREIDLLEAMAPLTWVNLLGLPAVVIPFDMTPEGLPVGVQMVGRPCQEELLLELAVRLEDVRGAFPAPRLLVDA